MDNHFGWTQQQTPENHDESNGSFKEDNTWLHNTSRSIDVSAASSRLLNSSFKDGYQNSRHYEQ